MTTVDQADIFLTVIETHKGIIYKVANTYCSNASDREDLVQEIILQLWKSFYKYNTQYKYSTWIYRIALNVAISFYRKQKRRKEITNPIQQHFFNITDVPEDKKTEGQAKFLQQFIAELKELDKALILLYLEEKSHKEIAGIMGLSETNVATKLGRIKLMLKQKFSQITI